MKKSTKYTILIVANLIIFLLAIFAINLDSFGALIPGIIAFSMAYIINPILTIVFFRKDNNRFLRVLIELLVSVILIGIVVGIKY